MRLVDVFEGWWVVFVCLFVSFFFIFLAAFFFCSPLAAL